MGGFTQILRLVVQRLAPKGNTCKIQRLCADLSDYELAKIPELATHMEGDPIKHYSDPIRHYM